MAIMKKWAAVLGGLTGCMLISPRIGAAEVRPQNNIWGNVVISTTDASDVGEGITLTGKVEVRGEGETQLTLLRVSEDEAYFIVPDETGRKLLPLAGQTVAVTGVKTDRGVSVRQWKVITPKTHPAVD